MSSDTFKQELSTLCMYCWVAGPLNAGDRHTHTHTHTNPPLLWHPKTAEASIQFASHLVTFRSIHTFETSPVFSTHFCVFAGIYVTDEHRAEHNRRGRKRTADFQFLFNKWMHLYELGGINPLYSDAPNNILHYAPSLWPSHNSKPKLKRLLLSEAVKKINI